MAEGSKKALGAWVATAVLAVGVAGAAVWAVPAYQEGQALAEGAGASFSAPAPRAGTEIFEQRSTAPVDAARLEAELSKLVAGFTQGSASLMVSDLETGEVLVSRGADEARVPASNFKLLTDYVLLRAVEPTSRFSTSFVAEGKTLTLVAGGDTLLSTGESDPDLTVGRAGLLTLTNRAVEALAEQGGKGEYTVNLDTSIYQGDALNPTWHEDDIAADFVTGVRPLAFYSHYSPAADGKPSTQRPQDAAAQVHEEALAQLNSAGKKHGISFVLGGEEPASAAAETIATVESATAAEQAAYMMQESDNMLAEVLARNAALARGAEGSIAGARETILEVLTEDGVNTEGLQIVDFSGLSLENRVTAQTLLEITERIVEGEQGADAALNGFPIAGGTGTLAGRFDDSAEHPAQGYARAKTGTLNSVIALSGYTTNSSGRVLLFSIITNDVEDPAAAKDFLDRSVALITES